MSPDYLIEVKKVIAMKFQRTLFLVPIALILAAGGLAAQENDINSSRINLIRSMAESDDSQLKAEALQLVNRMYEEGSIEPGDDAVINMVITLGVEPYTNPRRTGVSPNLANDFPRVRSEAAVTLGRIGGPLALKGLIAMVGYEEDPDVMKNIMYAFGNIGLNPDNSATVAIGRKIRRLNALGKIDDELAYATLYAIDRIASRNGGIYDDGIFDTLHILYNDKFTDVVVNKAKQVYEMLWNQDHPAEPESAPGSDTADEEGKTI